MKRAWLLLLAVGSLAEALELDPRLEDLRASQDIAGVCAVVVSRDQLLYAGASGVADLETGRALDPDSVFYAGSVSKVLTAVLVLHLAEQGRIALGDRVSVIAAAPVTVGHLVTHASGLPREGDFGYWFTAEFPGERELHDYLGRVRLRNPPGADLHYSNIGYAALGPVVAASAGQDFAEALRARVLDPLQMSKSGASGPASGIVNGYSPPGRLLPSAERPFAGVGEKVGSRHVRMYHDARAMSPAFGAYSSASDLGRLARFLLGHGGEDVLSLNGRRAMFERQSSGWGLGLRIEDGNGRYLARHGGWFAAHRSHLLLDLRHRLGVVVLTNGDNADPERIADELLAAALAELGKAPARPNQRLLR